MTPCAAPRTTRGVQVIEVSSALGLRPHGVEEAPAALVEAGLAERLASAAPVKVDVPVYDERRDETTGILNGPGIAAVARELARSVDEALDTGRFPVVLGGDCSILLGAALALRRRGRYGLVFIDGHADFQHPSDEENGEVASLDLALATGRGPALLADLDGVGPLVRDDDVAVVGMRAHGDNDEYLGEHVTRTAMTVLDCEGIRRSGVNAAVAQIAQVFSPARTVGFWVHLDVDVLDPEQMPAVDYRVPGGLEWDQARKLLGGLLRLPGAVGLEVTIFNPRLDADGSLARRLVDLVTTCVPA